jgi:hypothetical protein
MLADDQHETVRLAMAANAIEAHIWQQALEREGIRSQVLGDYLDAGIGDGTGLTAEVWVEANDAARAEAFFAPTRSRIRSGGPRRRSHQMTLVGRSRQPETD